MSFSLLDFPTDPEEFLTRLHARYGDIASLETHGRQVVFVFSPNLNQAVLSQPDLFHSMFFPVRGSRRSAQRRVTCGLLSMNGPAHRADRRSLKPVFSREAIKRYLEPVNQVTERFLANWRTGAIRDVADDMTRLALEITSSMLFGIEDMGPALALGRLIEQWVKLNHQTGIAAFEAADHAHETYERLLVRAEQIEQQLTRLIDERRGRGDRTDRHDILSVLSRRLEAGELSQEQVIGHTALLFAAAHMTTAHSLTWSLLLLAQHPEIAAGLRHSTDEHNPAIAANNSLWDRVIKESMRILPASAYSQRVAQAETMLNNVRCRRGTTVLFSQFVTHRRGDLFPDGDVFRPDRWLEINPSPYAYLPFGAGPRMCLGGPLALAEMKVILPRIVERFSFTLVADQTVNAKIVSTMLSPTTPVRMKLALPTESGSTVRLRGNIGRLVRFPEPARRSFRRRRSIPRLEAIEQNCAGGNLLSLPHARGDIKV